MECKTATNKEKCTFQILFSRCLDFLVALNENEMFRYNLEEWCNEYG